MNSGIEKAQLEIVHDVQIGDWIKDSLAPWEAFSQNPATIGIFMPKGFESYLLIRHDDPSGAGGSLDSLSKQSLENLEEILSHFTTTPEDCFHALWDGQGWMHAGGIVAYKAIKHPELHRFLRPIFRRFRTRRFRGRRPTPIQSLDHLESNTLPQRIMESERFKLPNREYLLMRGPLTEAKKIGYSFSGRFDFESPNLLWPSDRSWLMVTDIQFEFTLIGGSEKLIQFIVSTNLFTVMRFKVTDEIDQLLVVEY